MQDGGKPHRTGTRGVGRGRKGRGSSVKSGGGFRQFGEGGRGLGGGGRGGFRGLGGGGRDGSRGGGRGGLGGGGRDGSRGGGRRGFGGGGRDRSRGGGRGDLRRGGKGKKGNNYNYQLKSHTPEEEREESSQSTEPGLVLPQQQNLPVEYSQEKLEKMSTEEFNEEITKILGERDRLSLYVRFPSTLTVTTVADLYNCLKDAVAGGVIRLSKNRFYRKKHGYCYIDFKGEAFARKRKHMISQVEVEGKKFMVDLLSDKYTKRHVENLDLTQLFVTNLPVGITRRDLSNIFSTSSKIIFPKRKHHNRERNFAYVMYATKQEAFKVFYCASNITFKGNLLNVTFSKLRRTQDTSTCTVPETDNGEEDDNSDDASDVSPPTAKKMKVEGKSKKKQVVADKGDKNEGDDKLEVGAESFVDYDEDEEEDW